MFSSAPPFSPAIHITAVLGSRDFDQVGIFRLDLEKALNQNRWSSHSHNDPNATPLVSLARQGAPDHRGIRVVSFDIEFQPIKNGQVVAFIRFAHQFGRLMRDQMGWRDNEVEASAVIKVKKSKP